MGHSAAMQKDIEFADSCRALLANPTWTITTSEPDEYGTTRTIATAIADGREWSLGYITTKNTNPSDAHIKSMMRALDNSMAQLLSMSPEERDNNPMTKGL